MSGMNFHGTIHADCSYTEEELMKVLGLSRPQMIEYYKLGLNFFQRTRKEPRQVVGDEYHRFIARNSQAWPEDEEGES